MMKYTEDNIGDEIDYSDDYGTYLSEKVVMVYCSVCGARFIGPIRQAGGFLGGHEAFHSWEFQLMLNSENGLVA